VGGLRLSQKALPLGVRIEKLGEAEVAGAARAFDLAVFPANAPGAAAIGARAADIEFVHGHFWKLSEADRLRAPAYDLLKSGFEIAASDKLEIDFSRARTSEYGYELVMIGDESDALASPLFAFSNAVAGDLSRWMAAEHRAFVSPLDGRATVSPAADRPLVNENRFAPAGVTVGAGPFADIGLRVGESARNPIVADYLMAGA